MSVDHPAFLDTNILVYAWEKGDSHRKQTAARLLDHLTETNQLRLSTQVLQELYVTLTRKLRPARKSAEALAILDHLSQWPITALGLDSIRTAATLSESATLSFWDALIIVGAAHSGAQTLYSEDLNHGQLIHGVRIVNPFR